MSTDSHYQDTAADNLKERQSPLQGSDTEKLSKSSSSRLGRSLLFLLCGLAVFLFGSPYFTIFPTNKNPYYLFALATVFLAGSFFLRRSSRFSQYQPVAYAFFIASFANLILTLGLFNFLIQRETALQEVVTDKLAQFLAIVLPIIILTKIAGDDLGSIFINRGNIRTGLIFGLVSFGLFALLALTGATGIDITLKAIIPAVPGILIFVFANSIMEELWFRAIFLKRFEPFLAVLLSVLVTSLVFGAAHFGATYVSAAEIASYIALVFAVGFVAGYVMLKTDSIWGSVLFHAGADLMVILPVLDSLS